MLKNKNINILLITSLLLIILVWFGPNNLVYKITREDGPIENLTAIFYLIGFSFALYSIFKKRNLTMAIVWCILCFLFLGEETSWFQRILNYSVESVEGVNSQNEFNIHNLSIFKGEDILIDGKINMFGVFNFLKSTQNLFRLGFFGFFVILPLLALTRLGKRFLNKVNYIYPEKQFILVILIVFALSFVLAFFLSNDIKMALAETRELIYSIFICAYIIFYIYKPEKTN